MSTRAIIGYRRPDGKFVGDKGIEVIDEMIVFNSFRIVAGQDCSYINEFVPKTVSGKLIHLKYT